MDEAVIRATFELEPAGSADALAVEESVGVADGPEAARGRVVSEDRGRAVVEFPAANWGPDVTMLVSALVAGEAHETAAFTRCRLVDLALPPGMFPGPAFTAPDRLLVGAIVKPSLGLSAEEVGEVAGAAARGGADLIKDDELLGDPVFCPFEDRVRCVMDAVGPDVVYCPNVTGPVGSLLFRAERAVELGATGVMVNAFAQGLDAVRLLRDADLGVPVFAHRVGSGPWVRNERFGVAGPVLAALTRLCGADCVQVGAFAGKLFDGDDDVRAQIAACRDAALGVPAALAVIGGGVGPHNARAQVDAAGGAGLMVLLGQAAYSHPGGVEEGVRATVDALAS